MYHVENQAAKNIYSVLQGFQAEYPGPSANGGIRIASEH